ncbi:MAG: PIN domain-containing protein [Gemmatimonadota bacterium]|nr:PIN domain-containing protein [Gemmatimonadota bacterium]
MTRALFDTNVLLDVLANRAPFAEDSRAALGRAEVGRIDGFAAAHAVTTLHYFLARDIGRAKARRALTDLMRIVDVAAVDADRIRHALALDWTDFEDAVHVACAEAIGADYIVTRDKKGFRRSPVRPLTPTELAALR